MLEQATNEFCRASCCASGEITSGDCGPEQVWPLLMLFHLVVGAERPHIASTLSTAVSDSGSLMECGTSAPSRLKKSVA